MRPVSEMQDKYNSPNEWNEMRHMRRPAGQNLSLHCCNIHKTDETLFYSFSLVGFIKFISEIKILFSTARWSYKLDMSWLY